MSGSALSLSGPLADVAWLAARLDEPGLLILDASVGAHRRPVPAIPGARPFDLDGPLSAPDSTLPHTMPGQEQFEREVRALGLDRTDTVVVYDNAGVYSSARGWWMLRAMGFDRVAVLDGGLPAWRAAGLPQQEAPAAPARPGDFTARPRPELIVDSAAVLDALADPASAVLDARAHDRFTGAAPEPRPGLRGGHMPGAHSLPFGDLLDDGGRFLPKDELRARFTERLGDRPERLLFSCGSGVTACVLALGATLAGYADHSALAVYDGSWSEWGLPSALPVVSGETPTGPAV
ncbi:sulfurtransferase [Streptacidiphilus rugosus]|uniref:sulfurtransferase n=1 Tax=Streptacidiphilus rugosus TaxID=405783 RepID=UPI00055FA2C6|nr:sulfurtransferase [Streptacidiphilus rugosus]